MKIICKYKKVLEIGMQTAIVYRIDFLMGFLSGVIPFFVQIFIWKSAYSVNQGESINGYNFGLIIVYLFAANVVMKLVSCLSQYQIADEIKNGDVCKYLLKPINHLAYYIITELGGKIFLMVFIYIIMQVIRTFFGGNINIITCLMQIVIMFFSFIINFFIYYLIALSAFWISKTSSLFSAFGLINAFLCGGIIPLDFLPSTFANILSITPFGLTVYYPVKVLISDLPFMKIALLIILQALWICLLGALCILIWRKGIKKYSSYGG